MLFHPNDCECGPCVRYRRNLGTKSLARKIAIKGGRLHPERMVYVAPWAPHCDEPIGVTRYITSREAVDGLKAMECHMYVPCRKCETCLQFRQMHWRERAIAEMEALRGFNRTWLITLTFSPVHLAGCILEAKAKDGDLEPSAYKHVQRYLKRLRREGARFRYLAVFERGEQTGRPHYHLLLHETGDKPIAKSTLDDQWRSFTSCKVCAGVAAGAASYVTKYTLKSLNIRPRASTNYGQPSSPPPPQVVGGSLLKREGKEDDAQH